MDGEYLPEQKQPSYLRQPELQSSGDWSWVKRLVRNEAELIRTGTGDLLGHQDHRKVVDEITHEFMEHLKNEFVSCVDAFNSYRGGAHLPNAVKIFNVSNTENDFILFRNNLKLVISNSALGVINFAFISRHSNFKGSPVKTQKEGYDLIAQMFPFNELAWTFHGERINVECVVRYMFTEFIKSSAQY